MTASRLTGNTVECLRDFFTKNPHLPAIELLVKFCDTNLATAQRWQRGEYIPEGLQLLRIRCFLTLAGYGVTEWYVLPAAKKHVAMIVALGLETPQETAVKLGFKGDSPVGSLWRITLANGGYMPTVKEEITKLHRKHRNVLKELQARWRERTLELLVPIEPTQVTVPVSRSDALIEDVVATFTKMVMATAGFGYALEREGISDRLRGVTRGGQDLRELAALLTRLADSE